MCSLKINSIVKITEILTEDFWDLQAQQDRQMNPEAAAYAAEQADQYTDSAVNVITAYQQTEPVHTTRARRGRTASAGWQGRVNVRARAGHITDQHRDRLLQQTGSETNPPAQH